MGKGSMTAHATPNEPDYPPPPGGPPPPADIGRLLLRCHDRPGIIAAVSTFLARAGANIISLDQHSTAPEGGTFLQRAIFHLPGLTVPVCLHRLVGLATCRYSARGSWRRSAAR